MAIPFLNTAYFSTNVGIGTETPTTIASQTGVTELLTVNGSLPRIAVQGTAGARVDLVDLGGGVDDKWMQIYTDGGTTTFRSITDNGASILKNNILVLDITAGNVGIGTTSPGAKLSIVGDGGANSGIGFKQTGSQEHKIYPSTNIQYNLIGSSSPIWAFGQWDGVSGLSGAAALDLRKTSATFSGTLAVSGSGDSYFTGDLGIGTTSPLGKLHVSSGVSGASANGNADEIVVSNDNNAGISILTPNTAIGRINFGDPEDNDVGKITYDHSTDKLAIFSGAGQAITIDSNQDVGIGATDPTSKLHVLQNVTDPDLDQPQSFAVQIDSNHSGSAATTGDREQGGLFIDVDSSTTGGGTVDEHRLFGIKSDVRHTGDSDKVVAGNFFAEQNTTTGTTTDLRGVSASVSSDGGTSAVLTSAAGIYSSVSMQDATPVSNSYGGTFLNLSVGNRTALTSNSYGVKSEIQIDSTSNFTNLYAGHFSIDSNTAYTATNSYLLYLDYAGTSLANNIYSIYSPDDVKSYHAGDFGFGATVPSEKVDVNGGIRLRGALKDVNNVAGNAGQILSSTGTTVDWVDASTVIGGPYVDLTTNQTVNGYKTFNLGLQVGNATNLGNIDFTDGTNNAAINIGDDDTTPVDVLQYRADGGHYFTDWVNGSTYTDLWGDLFHSTATISEINTLGNTALITKEYSDSKYLLNTTDTLTGNLAVTNQVQINGNNKLVLDSDEDGFSWIKADPTGPDLIYGSPDEHHFINGEDGAFATVRADRFTKDGGTSSQFLKADGSVDSTGPFLPIANPAFTGVLTGPTGIFTANAVAAKGTVEITSADPTLRFKYNGGSAIADQNTYEIRNMGLTSNTYLQFRTINDAENVFTTRMALWQSGGLYLGSSITDVGAGNFKAEGTGVFQGTGDSYFTGNLGIGTTSPGAKLEISDSTAGFAGIITNNNDASQGLQVRTSDNDSDEYILDLQSSSSATGTDYASKFVVTKSGNVGIGTTSPNTKLNVVGGDVQLDNGQMLSFFSNRVANVQNNGIKGSDADDSIRLFTAAVERLTVKGGNVGIGQTNPASYKLDVSGTGRFTGTLAVSGAGDNYFVGNLGIGDTSPSYKLDVSGEIAVGGVAIASYNSLNDIINLGDWDGGGAQLDLWADGVKGMTLNPNGSLVVTSTVTATNFILSSDERLKENIKELEPKKINTNWKSFNLKDSEEDYRVGVIAQELEVTNPEFVVTNDEGFKSVKYIDLLISKIAELEARLEKAGI